MAFVDRFVISSFVNRIEYRVREGRRKGKKGAATLSETIIETVAGPLCHGSNTLKYTIHVSMPETSPLLSSPRVSTIQLKYVAVFKGPVPCPSPPRVNVRLSFDLCERKG